MDTPIGLWLTAINLHQYAPALVSAGYVTPRLCATLTDTQLAQMGVSLPGHRKRIICYLSQLKASPAVTSPPPCDAGKTGVSSPKTLAHNTDQTDVTTPVPHKADQTDVSTTALIAHKVDQINVTCPLSEDHTIDPVEGPLANCTGTRDPVKPTGVCDRAGKAAALTDDVRSEEVSVSAAQSSAVMCPAVQVVPPDASQKSLPQTSASCLPPAQSPIDDDGGRDDAMMAADRVAGEKGGCEEDEVVRGSREELSGDEPLPPPRPCGITNKDGYFDMSGYVGPSDFYDVPQSPRPPEPAPPCLDPPQLPPKLHDGVPTRPAIPSRPVPKPRTSLVARRPIPTPRGSPGKAESPVAAATRAADAQYPGNGDSLYDLPVDVRTVSMVSSSSGESTYDSPAEVRSGVVRAARRREEGHVTAPRCTPPAGRAPHEEEEQIYDVVCEVDSLDRQIPAASGAIYEEMVHDVRPSVDEGVYAALVEPIYEAPPGPPAPRPPAAARPTGPPAPLDPLLSVERIVVGAEADADDEESPYGQMWKMASGMCVDAPPSAHVRLSHLHPLSGTPLIDHPPPIFLPPALPEGASFGVELHKRQSGVGADAAPCVPPRLHRQQAVEPPSGGDAYRSSCDITNQMNELLAQRMNEESCSGSSGAARTARKSKFNPRLPHLSVSATKALDNVYGDVEFVPPQRPVTTTRQTGQYMYDPMRGTYSLDDSTPPPLTSCDSEDNLSDGGDFYEEPREASPPLLLDASNSLTRNSEKRTVHKKGYLYKHASKASSSRGWLKKWVTFEEKRLRYYSTHKSTVSKRVIPLSTIRKVQQVVKAGEVHPYRFIVTTVDRIYSFASDDNEEISTWADILQKSIQELGAAEMQQGGEMCNPNKQGFVKMDGIKLKRYFAVKGAVFCYYNTYNDYKVASPVHMIELKLASVKEVSRHRVTLINPYSAYTFIFDKEEEASEWREAFEEGIADGLGDDTVQLKVYENHSNQQCADCGMPDPHWASINLAITLCKHCAGVHRGLGVTVSKVRSLRMDFRVWTDPLVQVMKMIGNDNANAFWEWNTTEDDRIDSDADAADRKVYIGNKYVLRQYCRLHPLQGDQLALDEALCKAVQHEDIIESMQLLFSGANIHCVSKTFGEDNTPLLLARAAQQLQQLEFLLQNGAETESAPMASPPAQTFSPERTPSQRGYLHKTGSNPKGEFRRRWCVLEDGVLSYYENKKSLVPKDSIEKADMISIGTSWCDRFEFTFELSTSKHGGRVYQFAAESDKDRLKWIVSLAKTFARVPIDAMDQIHDMERGGEICVREGATSEWTSSWLHLNRKTLHLYNKDEGKFEEIDLRKVKRLVTVQPSDQSVDSVDNIQPFVVDLPNRAVYLQSCSRKETDAWFNVIYNASMEGGSRLSDQQLTADNVPIIVDKCVNFISTHGMTVEGIYRHNGQHSKVTRLLDLFVSDAKLVHLTLDEFTIHEVTTALKRFLRTLNEPILTDSLYEKWISATNIDDFSARTQWYKYLLGELDVVNYRTLKRMNTHLCRVAENARENKMSFTNLSAIFGMVFMATSQESVMSTGFNSTNNEIATVRQLLENHELLFEVKEDELEQERKISEAIKKIEQLQNVQGGQAEAVDMLIGVYIENRAGKVVTHKVSERMTAAELLAYVVDKSVLDGSVNWGLFEVVCDNELQRPLEANERVLGATLRYAYWPEEFRRNNFLCVKERLIDEKLQLFADASNWPLFGELRYSEKKSFKKSFFKLGQHCLSCFRDTKATTPVSSWNVDDLTFYLGAQSKRAPPTRWSFTFIVNFEKIVKSRDSPYFGHTVCCNTEEELFRWLAGLMITQSSELHGSEDDSPDSNLQTELDTTVPVYARFVGRSNRASVFKRFLKR